MLWCEMLRYDNMKTDMQINQGTAERVEGIHEKKD